MFTLRQLEIFVKLSETSRVTETADVLGMSSSAVSMAVKELEKISGEALFERIGKRLVLNERGRYFYEHARRILQEANALYETFLFDTGHGHLRLCASVTISNYLLPEWIGEYRNEHEKVKVSLKTANSTDVIESIRSGEYDLGFIEGKFEADDLDSMALMDDELVVITCDASLAQRSYYIDELVSRRWVLREKGSGTREVFLSHIAPMDKELPIDIEFEHNEAIKRYVKHDLHSLTCLPKVSVAEELQNRTMFEVTIKGHRFEREFRMIWRKQKRIAKIVEEFKRYVSERKIA